MADIPRFNYNLHELNEWVRRDSREAQLRVAGVPCLSYDLQELNEWAGRDHEAAPLSRYPVGDSTAPIEDEAMGLPGVIGVVVGLVAAGILWVVLFNMVFTLVGF